MENTITKETIKKLEELYKNKKYDEYNNIMIRNKDHFDLGTFHYNLGTVFAKKGDWGAARYNLETSLKKGLTHPALLKNLKVVTSKVVERRSYEDSKLEELSFQFTSLGEEIVLMFSLIFVLILALLVRFKYILRRSVIFIVFFLCFMPTYMKYIIDLNYDVAVNLKKLNVYEGPSEIYEIVTEIESGQKLLVGKNIENWMYISYPSIFSGWTKRNGLGFLKD